MHPSGICRSVIASFIPNIAAVWCCGKQETRQFLPARSVSMQIKPSNRYDLKDVHQEIDLFDRKIAYCQSHEKFDSEQERASALQKLITRRGTLVKVAEEAASRGIEFDPKYLPRSLKQPAAAEKVEL
jgi:predicted component of type VI protein secretion system